MFTRYIDIDRLLRYYEPRARLAHIVWSQLSPPVYQLSDGAYILQDWLFRVGSTKNPQMTLQTNLYSNNILSVVDGQGREFFLGKAVANVSDSINQGYEVIIDSNDQAVFQVSRSIIPYYYGWNFFSTTHLFRYFRYYTLSIRQANGATLRAKWQLTTYQLPDGSWVPDHFGLRDKGLIQLNIEPKQ